jgi:hypothetical protein
VLRSPAGRLESPFGEVVAIASEHDEAAVHRLDGTGFDTDSLPAGPIPLVIVPAVP